tara:strand:+ start:119 stop:427 length:309 start_codon:yes stop_codon:yes gene_type:complete
MLEKRCTTCNIIKNKNLFHKYSLCKKCAIINDVGQYLLFAKLANHFNKSIEEIDNILTIDDNDPSRNAIGEHIYYDDVMLELVKYSNSQFNNRATITRFLDE